MMYLLIARDLVQKPDFTKSTHKTITVSDINEFFRKNVDQKRKPVGSNSFVAPHSAYECQMDLFFYK